ncbi:unnamed protein product [Effrenium voratum]|nr:unnamed protein product [Effrenium voratum]
MAPAQSPPELLRATSRSSAASERFSFEDDESLDFEAKQEDAGPRARILDLAGLEQEQNRLIAEAVECTGVSEDEAVLLLRFCHWDVAAFNEAFFEDAAALRGAAGVSEAQDVPMSPRACGICFCEPGKALMACPEAHPLFCETCWRQYLDHAVRDGKGCLDLRCPAPGCQEMVRPSLFDQLLAEGRQRYRRFLTESLVDASKGRLRWCPGQNCCCAASETPEVQCFCGCGWCFFCGNDLHAPVACDTVKSWEEKNRDEGCDAVWIKVNTKLCPKCGNPIEKNGGCMHMTCRKPGGCGHEFCWICLKDWQNHQQCNAADDDLVNRSKAASKHELLRYAHYFERYLAHHKAEKFAAAGQRQALEAVAEQFIKSLGVTAGNPPGSIRSKGMAAFLATVGSGADRVMSMGSGPLGSASMQESFWELHRKLGEKYEHDLRCLERRDCVERNDSQRKHRRRPSSQEDADLGALVRSRRSGRSERGPRSDTPVLDVVDPPNSALVSSDRSLEEVLGVVVPGLAPAAPTSGRSKETRTASFVGSEEDGRKGRTSRCSSAFSEDTVFLPRKQWASKSRTNTVMRRKSRGSLTGDLSSLMRDQHQLLQQSEKLIEATSPWTLRCRPRYRGKSNRQTAMARGFLVVASLALALGSACEGDCEEEALVQLSRKAAKAAVAPKLPPYGSNLGGWLCLEDWFFSGSSGRYVSTTDPAGQGVCLPPLLQGGKTTWPSEGVLVDRLAKSSGKTYAAQVFEAHRNSFIQPGDLKAMAEIGLKVVRVPVVWAMFADALAPLAPDVYGAHDPQVDSVVVPDPFYSENISLVTIPRQLLENLFAEGHQYGLKFLLDLHAMPGGSSDGTYNAVWPNKPVFWHQQTKLGKPLALQKAGLMIVQKAVEWMEGLTGDAKAALEGISPMNEPGHLAGFQSPTWAEPLEILEWLGQSVQVFKASKLPSQGKKLYMQVIETAFPDNSYWSTVPKWWKGLTTDAERWSWAVFDMHWYTAWGTKAGVLPDVAVLCSESIDGILKVLKPGLKGFAEQFAENIPGQKSCTEFSASTNADALLACQDVDITKAFMLAQVEAMESKGIKPFFWSLKMPYGRVFETEWSLKKIYGYEAEPVFECALGAGMKGADGAVPCFAGDWNFDVGWTRLRFFQSFWDFLGILLLVKDTVGIPLQLVDVEVADVFPAWTALSAMSVFYWIGDIVLSFFTGYLERGTLVQDAPTIARHYLRTTWFLVDLAVSLTDVMLEFGHMTDSLGESATASRFLRFLRIFRMLRLGKVSRVSAFLQDSFESEVASIQFSLFLVMVAMFLVEHVIACFWFGLGGDGGWLADGAQDTLFTQYSASMRWALAQLGFGATVIEARTEAEGMYSNFVGFISLVTSSSVISSMTSLVSALHRNRSEETKQLGQLRRFLRQNRVDPNLGERIMRFLQYTYQEQDLHHREPPDPAAPLQAAPGRTAAPEV